MATPRTYGSITEELPKGMLCRVDFPELMRLDVRTYDGRLFDSGGFSVMEEMMPFPLKFRPETKDGHDDALLPIENLVGEFRNFRVAVFVVG